MEGTTKLLARGVRKHARPPVVRVELHVADQVSEVEGVTKVPLTVGGRLALPIWQHDCDADEAAQLAGDILELVQRDNPRAVLEVLHRVLCHPGRYCAPACESRPIALGVNHA